MAVGRSISIDTLCFGLRSVVVVSKLAVVERHVPSGVESTIMKRGGLNLRKVYLHQTSLNFVHFSRFFFSGAAHGCFAMCPPHTNTTVPSIVTMTKPPTPDKFPMWVKNKPKPDYGSIALPNERQTQPTTIMIETTPICTTQYIKAFAGAKFCHGLPATIASRRLPTHPLVHPS